ncbi:hypothetical protein [Candidatus Spongiihabitans sp.]|uniref:hypothetical protein n=1 Tax=Candidatus Spongiihabitans sp. TaxID=3101308 RepID=UPI003C7EBFB4
MSVPDNPVKHPRRQPLTLPGGDGTRFQGWYWGRAMDVSQSPQPPQPPQPPNPPPHPYQGGFASSTRDDGGSVSPP